MTSQRVTIDPIEFRHTLTQHDLVDGIAGQRHGTRRVRRIALLVVSALVGLAIGFARSTVWQLPADSAATIVAACLILVALAAGIGLLAHRVLARRMALVPPKRALVEDDAARLRALLDTRSRRRT